jgi:DNA repair ATPase RecN
MHAKNKEHLARNDARTAELDEYQGKLDARAAELDEYQGKLDARASELDEYQGKLDARDAELDEYQAKLDAKTVTNEEAIAAAPVNAVKRPREAEYSFLMQAAEELKKIHASDWDDETKQVFKKRLLDIIQRDD